MLKKLAVSEAIRCSRDMYEWHRTGVPQIDHRGRFAFKPQKRYPYQIAASSDISNTRNSNSQTVETNKSNNGDASSILYTLKHKMQKLVCQKQICSKKRIKPLSES